jgi:hypothetical protein
MQTGLRLTKKRGGCDRLLCFPQQGSPARSIRLTGTVVAYRPVDRIMQFASFVENTEAFLFQSERSKKGVIKLLYVHYGYSDITDDVLSGDKRIAAVVHRNKSCDQTLESFEKEIPVLNLEGDLSTTVQPVIFGDEKLRYLPKDYRLECYLLDHWE